LVPFVFLLLGAAMRSMNPALEEASAGRAAVHDLLRVTLPVLRPGVLAPDPATLVALEQLRCR
jgi:iron(III) transport system permease protein